MVGNLWVPRCVSVFLVVRNALRPENKFSVVSPDADGLSPGSFRETFFKSLLAGFVCISVLRTRNQRFVSQLMQQIINSTELDSTVRTNFAEFVFQNTTQILALKCANSVSLGRPCIESLFESFDFLWREQWVASPARSIL